VCVFHIRLGRERGEGGRERVGEIGRGGRERVTERVTETG
jgi:hypothetical protein